MMYNTQVFKKSSKTATDDKTRGTKIWMNN